MYLFSKGSKKELDFIYLFLRLLVLNFKVSVLCTDWYTKSNSCKEDKQMQLIIHSQEAMGQQLLLNWLTH